MNHAQPAGEVRFLVLEFVRGVPLSMLLEEEVYLQEQEALAVAQQVLRVLALLHEKMRRTFTDFPLQNILLERPSTLRQAQDGAGSESDEGLPYVTVAVFHNVSERVPASEALPDGFGVQDFARFATYFYQMLTGEEVNEHEQSQQALVVRAGERWEEVSLGTRQLLMRALNPDPTQRFASARAFREAVLAQQALWQQDWADILGKVRAWLANPTSDEEEAKWIMVALDIARRLHAPARHVSHYQEQLKAHLKRVLQAQAEPQEEVKALRVQHELELKRQQAQHEQALQRQQAQHEQVLKRQQARHKKELKEQQTQHEQELKRQRAKHKKSLNNEESQYETRLTILRRKYKRVYAHVQQEHDERVANLRAEHEAELIREKERQQQALAAMQQEIRNTLSPVAVMIEKGMAELKRLTAESIQVAQAYFEQAEARLSDVEQSQQAAWQKQIRKGLLLIERLKDNSAYDVLKAHGMEELRQYLSVVGSQHLGADNWLSKNSVVAWLESARKISQQVEKMKESEENERDVQMLKNRAFHLRKMAEVVVRVRWGEVGGD